MKRKQIACVLTSPKNLAKKTSKVHLIKGAAKKRKLICTKAVSIISSYQQVATNPIEDDNNSVLSVTKIILIQKKQTESSVLYA